MKKLDSKSRVAMQFILDDHLINNNLRGVSDNRYGVSIHEEYINELMTETRKLIDDAVVANKEFTMYSVLPLECINKLLGDGMYSDKGLLVGYTDLYFASKNAKYNLVSSVLKVNLSKDIKAYFIPEVNQYVCSNNNTIVVRNSYYNDDVKKTIIECDCYINK